VSASSTLTRLHLSLQLDCCFVTSTGLYAYLRHLTTATTVRHQCFTVMLPNLSRPFQGTDTPLHCCCRVCIISTRLCDQHSFIPLIHSQRQQCFNSACTFNSTPPHCRAVVLWPPKVAPESRERGHHSRYSAMLTTRLPPYTHTLECFSSTVHTTSSLLAQDNSVYMCTRTTFTFLHHH